MPTEPNPSGTSQLQEAIAAIKAGDKAKGRKLLTLFLQDNPTHENALLWMSATTNDPAEKRRYFERVLQLNPDNEKAKQALAKLDDTEAPSLQDMTGQSPEVHKPSGDPANTKPAPVTVVWSKDFKVILWLFLVLVIICFVLFYIT